MQKSLREKIALIVFAVLAVLSLVGLGWYLFAGHSWNVAASTIDDTVGELEGYTVIVYEGTQEVPLETRSDSTVNTIDENVKTSEKESETSPTLAADNVADNAPVRQINPVDINLVQQDYLANGAIVVALDMEHLGRYNEGVILKRGDKRVGVMNVQESTTQLEIAQCMKAFRRANVDLTVVVTASRNSLGRVGNIDVAICTEQPNYGVGGQSENGTYFVSTPQKGNVGVVLVSPSKVISAKEVAQ